MEQELDLIGNEQAGMIAALLGLQAAHNQMFTKPAHRLPSDTPADNKAVQALVEQANLPDNNTLSPTSKSLGGTAEYVNRPGVNVEYNPQADRAFLAHELGHAGNYNNPGIGKAAFHANRAFGDSPKIQEAISQALAFNPELQKRVTAAGISRGMRALAPAAAAGLIEGDNDMAVSLGLSLAMTSPELIDEALATKNALKYMKDAGMPASGAQKRRLAGSYLGYLAKPLAMAVGGNIAGNLID